MKMIIVMNHRPHSVYCCVIEIYSDDRWMRSENPDQPVSRYAVISFVLPANAHVLAIQAQSTHIDLQSISMTTMRPERGAIGQAGISAPKSAEVRCLPLMFDPEQD
jgi:hypothetical protein